MGRYYRHPVAPILDYSYKLPFAELFKAMQMKETKQQESLDSMRKSYNQMDSIFEAIPGAKYDVEMRDKKMGEFDNYVKTMSQKDLTKGDVINDINNYIGDFARNEDVKAIATRTNDYNAKMKELQASKAKHGINLPEERYWLDKSLQQYNEGEGYERDLTLGEVKGHYDYMPDLLEVGKLIKPFVSASPREDGKYYYNVKTIKLNQKHIAKVIQSAMSTTAKQALENVWRMKYDQAQASGQPIPEHLKDFNTFVADEALKAAAPFIRNDSEVTRSGVNPDYDPEASSRVQVVTAPATKIDGATIRETENNLRENTTAINQSISSLKDAGIDVTDPDVSVQQIYNNLLEQDDPKNSGTLLALQEYQGLLQNQESMKNTLRATNDAWAATPQGEEYWEEEYENLKERHLGRNDNILEYQNDDGEWRKKRIENAQDLQDLVLSGDLGITERSMGKYIWDRMWSAPVTGPSRLGRADKRKNREELQEIVEQVYDNLADFAEEEDIANNMEIIKARDGTGLAKDHKALQDLLRTDQGLWTSKITNEAFGDRIKGEEIDRDKVFMNFTTGGTLDGRPIVWVTAYGEDKGTDPVINEPFILGDASDAVKNRLANEMIRTGRASGSRSMVNIGERMHASPIINELQTIGLSKSYETENLIRNQGTYQKNNRGRENKSQGKSIVKSLPDQLGANLGLRATLLPSNQIYYGLVRENPEWNPSSPNQYNRYIPVQHRMVPGQQSTNLNNPNRPIAAFKLPVLGWMMWKYRMENGGANAYWNGISETFEYLNPEK